MNTISVRRMERGISKLTMARRLGIGESLYDKKESNPSLFTIGEFNIMKDILSLPIDCISNIGENNCDSKSKYSHCKKNNEKINSYIYFIKDYKRGLIKIGKTTDLKKRMYSIRGSLITSGINVSCIKLVGLYPVIKEDLHFVESEIHFIFKDKRKYGEWFDISETDIDKTLGVYKKVYGVSILMTELSCEKVINASHCDLEEILTSNAKGKKFLHFKKEHLDIERIKDNVLESFNYL